MFWSESTFPTAPVKIEVEDSLEDQHAPLLKRSKLSSSTQQQHELRTTAFPVPPSQYNPLDEPSPLGLRLRKSPSLLDLIQMRLSQGNKAKVGAVVKKEQKGPAASNSNDKLKASNFPATVLKIGTWEYKSRHEGDLVAKCYFAKHKLVWEVLDGGLKNKIEIQWSDILALKATYADDEPGTLDVVLSRQPLFFRETNPQPRKHTLWQATSDFTGEQASINRRHYLQCPPGLLGKHFEKLIQCDPRLNYLSQQAEITLESPYFEPRISVFDESDEGNSKYDMNRDGRPTIFNLQDVPSSSGPQSSSSKNEQYDFLGTHQEQFSRETPSPSSVMGNGMNEANSGTGESKNLNGWDNIKVPGLHPSMSMSDLVSHIEHRFSEQRTSKNSLPNDERESLEILDEISSLLQKDPGPVQDFNFKSGQSNDMTMTDTKTKHQFNCFAPEVKSEVTEDSSTPRGESAAVSGKGLGMSRKDSVGELLLNLPRIASLPHFLFNISEDFNSHGSKVWDATAPDPKFLVYLKSYRNTVPVPRHWSQKRKFLQENAEDNKKLKEEQRDRMKVL
ncbi:Pre-rRNA-processing protein IPI3 [Heracleum sosnowskyi]|uniref:Pre-rRNA-processing protein IPI3 n=1 Tax=Heracleum sosnowskyi TaxID=360622 RepID=A0AAD8M591_9APIA|nr:Pre-rRNA-processing protein IPI3 [Heracleum sosnowskyi]